MGFSVDHGTGRRGIIHLPGVEGAYAPVEWLLALVLLPAVPAWWARGRAQTNAPAGIARLARIAAVVGAVVILPVALGLFCALIAPGQPKEGNS